MRWFWFMKGLLCPFTDIAVFFLCMCQNKVIDVREYFVFSSLRFKFVIGITAIEVTNDLT